MRNRLLPLTFAALTVVALGLAFLPASAPAACTPPYCPSHVLKVVKAGNGNGTVTSSPAGIDCGSQCSASYEDGTEVTLSAAAAPGSTFTGWTGGGGCSGTGKCEVTIKVHTTVTAHFTKAGVPPRPPNARSSKFNLRKVKHPSTGVVTIRVRVSRPGALTATGKRMKRARARGRAAGRFTLKLQLNREGLKALRASRGRQLRVRIAFVFTPTGGESGKTIEKKIIFRVVGSRAVASAATAENRGAAASAGSKPTGKAVVAASATIEQGKAVIRVFCNGPQPCHGTLELVAAGHVFLASSSFDLAAGRSRLLRLELTRRARKLLNRRSLRQARATGTGLHPHAVKLKRAS
jgi:hypothetical protein